MEKRVYSLASKMGRAVSVYSIASAAVFGCLLTVFRGFPIWLWVIVIFDLLAGLANLWIDLNTTLEVSDQGLAARSPLRTVSIGWDDVKRVVLKQEKLVPFSDKWSESAVVIGPAQRIVIPVTKRSDEIINLLKQRLPGEVFSEPAKIWSITS